MSGGHIEKPPKIPSIKTFSSISAKLSGSSSVDQKDAFVSVNVSAKHKYKNQIYTHIDT